MPGINTFSWKRWQIFHGNNARRHREHSYSTKASFKAERKTLGATSPQSSPLKTSLGHLKCQRRVKNPPAGAIPVLAVGLVPAGQGGSGFSWGHRQTHLPGTASLPLLCVFRDDFNMKWQDHPGQTLIILEVIIYFPSFSNRDEASPIPKLMGKQRGLRRGRCDMGAWSNFAFLLSSHISFLSIYTCKKYMDYF